MSGKKFLDQIRQLSINITVTNERIRLYGLMATSIPSPSCDKKAVKTLPSKDAEFVKWVLEKIILENKIKELEDKLLKVKCEATICLEQLNNEMYKNLLIMRYYDFRNWTYIANHLNVANSTIYRWHSEALAEFHKIYKERELKVV